MEESDSVICKLSVCLGEVERGCFCVLCNAHQCYKGLECIAKRSGIMGWH